MVWMWVDQRGGLLVASMVSSMAVSLAMRKVDQTVELKDGRLARNSAGSKDKHWVVLTE